jgi:hypothetical protein
VPGLDAAPAAEEEESWAEIAPLTPLQHDPQHAESPPPPPAAAMDDVDVDVDLDAQEPAPEPEEEIELTESMEAAGEIVADAADDISVEITDTPPPPAPRAPPPPPAAAVDPAATLVSAYNPLRQAAIDAATTLVSPTPITDQIPTLAVGGGARKPKATFGDGTDVLSASFIEGEHRVIIHTVEGQVKRGVIRDVDLMDTAIPLEQQAGFAPERIPVSRVKAIFFMTQAGVRLPAPNGEKIRVTFRDGRQVAGFSNDYNASDIGFFMVPADTRTNTARIYVFRSSVQGIATG